MGNSELPITLFSWVLAMAPILVLLVLLAVLRWKTTEAGPVGMFTAAAIALLVFQTPWFTLAVAAAKGVWKTLSSSFTSYGPLCCCM